MSETNLRKLYTAKQIQILQECRAKDWFMIINHGAVRSGKTQLDNDLFLFELQRVKQIADQIGVREPQYIMAGASASSIQDNVLQELYNKYGIEPKYDKYNNFRMFGVKVVQTFTSSVKGLQSIRGMTAFGAYINEASLANQQVFQEIINRCSGKGARVIADTNPDHPQHWLNTDYIQNPDPMILKNRFTLTDNDFLDPRYVESLISATPTGMFTDRTIHGLWVSGEGAVYRDFDERRHYIKSNQLPDNLEIYCGVDFGYEHKGSIVVCGDDRDTGVSYLIEEHTAQHREIDYWTDLAQGIRERYGDYTPFYCDSARPEHVNHFLNAGINASFGNKSVITGIEEVAVRIKNDRLFVCRDRVKYFPEEVHSYVWDKYTGKPVKQNDDVMDALRYAVYTHHKNSRFNTDLARIM